MYMYMCMCICLYTGKHEAVIITTLDKYPAGKMSQIKSGMHGMQLVTAWNAL